MLSTATPSFTAAPPRRTLLRIVCGALIAAELWRGLSLTPRWIAGTPPLYPGQYATRLIDAIMGIGILGAVLVAQTSFGSTRRGRIVYWSLLGTSAALLIVSMIADR